MTSGEITVPMPRVQVSTPRVLQDQNQCVPKVLPGPRRAEEADAQLMLRVQVGDRVAFGALYDSLGPRLYSFAGYLVGWTEAEDVLQQTFLQVWLKARDYNPALGSAFTWVSTIARRKAIDYLRSRESREKHSHDFCAEDDGCLPDEHVELRQAVRNLLQELDEEERSALLLAYFSGLTQNEIAQKLGVPLGTAKAWIRRGLLKLRGKSHAIFD